MYDIFFCPSLLTELQFSHIFLHPKTTKFTVITLQHIIDVHEIFFSFPIIGCLSAILILQLLE